MVSHIQVQENGNTLQILPVSHIQKRRSVEVSRLQSALHLALDPIPLLILPAEEQAKRGDQDRFDEMRDDHGPDSEGVGWSTISTLYVGLGRAVLLIILVEERPCNVASAVAEEQHSIGDNFLGVSCHH